MERNGFSERYVTSLSSQVAYVSSLFFLEVENHQTTHAELAQAQKDAQAWEAAYISLSADLERTRAQLLEEQIRTGQLVAENSRLNLTISKLVSFISPLRYRNSRQDRRLCDRPLRQSFEQTSTAQTNTKNTRSAPRTMPTSRFITLRSTPSGVLMRVSMGFAKSAAKSVRVVVRVLRGMRPLARCVPYQGLIGN